MAIEFRRDYELLELDAMSDWDRARLNYRRLVNQWHPDRYVDRPRERVHAQQRFIELTKSFNNLRNFHQKNQRMPFERIRRENNNSAGPAQSQKVLPGEQDFAKSSILNKRKTTKKVTKKIPSWSWWVLACAVMVACALAVFLYLDLMARKANTEEAQRVLKQATPSEFTAKPTDIAIQKTGKALFEDGKNTPGEKLTKDIFKKQ